jgi:hypothetical protein
LKIVAVFLGPVVREPRVLPDQTSHLPRVLQVELRRKKKRPVGWPGRMQGSIVVDD